MLSKIAVNIQSTLRTSLPVTNFDWTLKEKYIKAIGTIPENEIQKLGKGAYDYQCDGNVLSLRKHIKERIIHISIIDEM